MALVVKICNCRLIAESALFRPPPQRPAGGNMRCLAATFIVVASLAISAPLYSATANQQYVLTVDPQALAIAQSSFAAMGGAQVLAGYQDSVARGTVTIYSGG